MRQWCLRRLNGLNSLPHDASVQTCDDESAFQCTRCGSRFLPLSIKARSDMRATQLKGLQQAFSKAEIGGYFIDIECSLQVDIYMLTHSSCGSTGREGGRRRRRRRRKEAAAEHSKRTTNVSPLPASPSDHHRTKKQFNFLKYCPLFWFLTLLSLHNFSSVALNPQHSRTPPLRLRNDTQDKSVALAGPCRNVEYLNCISVSKGIGRAFKSCGSRE
jgi:hypothetical protein